MASVTVGVNFKFKDFSKSILSFQLYKALLKPDLNLRRFLACTLPAVRQLRHLIAEMVISIFVLLLDLNSIEKNHE